jgi:OTU-like cysteine protease
LHALSDILCGGSNYRQLRPATSSLHDNRTVVIAVLPSDTFWVVIHSSWNHFRLEAFGKYASQVFGLRYKSEACMEIIKDTLDPCLRTALTDMTASDQFAAVDHIKIVVKQLRDYKAINFSRMQAGALTNCTVHAMKQLCNETVGSNSKLCERNDKHLGSIYVNVNVATQQKFQVVRSSGKHTNTLFSLLDWMKENVPEFVNHLQHRLSQNDKLSFFTALQNLASSEATHLGMLELSPSVVQKLMDESSVEMSDESKMLLADLTLIAVNTNQQHVKSIAANYRKTGVCRGSTLKKKQRKQTPRTPDNAMRSDSPCQPVATDASCIGQDHAAEPEPMSVDDDYGSLPTHTDVLRDCAEQNDGSTLKCKQQLLTPGAPENSSTTDTQCQPGPMDASCDGQEFQQPSFDPSKQFSRNTPPEPEPMSIEDNCAPARSHTECLRRWAERNNAQLLDTIGGGDCFFHAIQIGLAQLGIKRTIAELREAAATEMTMNATAYRPLYYTEDNLLREQASTFEQFVQRNFDGSEWATEITVSAMARSLDVVVRVVSSGTDENGYPTAAVLPDYNGGIVDNRRVITVAYNAAESHYLALRF